MTDYADKLRRERREEELAANTPKFEPLARYLSLADFGWGSRTFRRLQAAASTVREQRRLTNYRGGDYEAEILSVRLVADALAEQILAAADGRDADTIAWVAAGLRCPRDPFCAGCNACQTVTSPLRPAEARRSLL